MFALPEHNSDSTGRCDICPAQYQELARRVVAQTLRGSGFRFNSDLQEDCLAEAVQLLVREHGKLAALPEPKRKPYAIVCVRRVTRRAMQREHRQRLDALSLDSLFSSEGYLAEVLVDKETTCGAARLDSLVDAAESPTLQSALQSLPAGWLRVLELRLLHNLSYREIARVVGTSEGCARSQCCQALARLRGQVSV